MFKVGGKVRFLEDYECSHLKLIGAYDFRCELVKELPDMSQNVKPYGLCSPEEQKALNDVDYLQVYDGEAWSPISTHANLINSQTYRTYTPLEDIYIPWEHVADEYKWATRDDDGTVAIWRNEKPVAESELFFWYANGGSAFLGEFLKGVKPGNKPWNESLVQRPEGV